MTRGEAIRILTAVELDDRNVTDETIKAISIAIKALEQEPCEDCVDRELVKRDIERWKGYLDDDMIARMCITIDKLPSVKPTSNLDKIRAEIVAYNDLIGHNAQIQWCLKVIDKYRKEQK